MVGKVFFGIAFLIGFLSPNSVFAETPSPSPSASLSTLTRPAPPAAASPAHTAGSDTAAPIQRPPSETPAPPDFDSLVRQLKELPNPQVTGGVVDAWWRAAHGVLDALEKKDSDPHKAQDDANAIANQLASGPRQDLFKALISARFIDDPLKLRNWVFNPQFTANQREAARQDIQRRLKDPNVKLIAEQFHMRPEMAMLFTDKILRARDGAEAGPIVAKIMGTLNKDQRTSLFNATTQLKPQAQAKGLNEKLLQWLNDAASKSIGNTVASNPFNDAFDHSYQDVLRDNLRFHQLVKVALGPDAAAAAAAKRSLLSEYDPESVMDFISAQLGAKNDGVAVDSARAFAKDDGQGNLSLQLHASNAGFGEQNQEQSLLLGNKDKLEEIRAALHAFQDGSEVTSGEIVHDFDPQTTNRFQLFGIQDPAATQTNPRRLFAENQGGKPVLRVADQAGRPAGRTLATEEVKWPSTIPNVPGTPATASPAPTPQASPTPGGATAAAAPGGFTAAGVEATIAARCNGCHQGTSASGNTLKDLVITVKGHAKTLTDALNALPNLMVQIPEDLKASIRAWAAAAAAQ